MRTAISKVQSLLGDIKCLECTGTNMNIIIVLVECSILLITFAFVILQFRAAIQLQFDFHRAIYNLGTVLVGLLVILSLYYFYGMILSF